MADKRVIITIIVVVALVVVFIASGAAIDTGPTRPNVNFVGFNAEGTIPKKIGEPLIINFNIENKEDHIVSNVNVATAFEGNQAFFRVDNSGLQIPTEIGKDGTSGPQQIKITGLSTGIQSGIIVKFNVTLTVDRILAETKNFEISLTK